MKIVSNAFKERMNSRRDFYLTAEITFADGTVKNLTEADFNMQGNSIIQGGATSSFPLGVLSSKQITLSLFNDDDKWEEYGFYNAKIKLATVFQTNERDEEETEDFTPVIERIQEGIFTVITPETYGTTIEITAMDESYKTDKEYNSSIQFPARLDDALRDCCAGCGITLYSDDIPNKDFIIQKKPEGISFRDFIGNCAMIAGGNAVMDNYNRLKIITYDFSAFSDQEKAANIPVLKDFKPGLRLEAIDVEITGLQITGEVTETDEDGSETTTEQTFKYGEDGYVLTLTNELAAGNEEAFLQAVGSIIAGSRFRAFSGDSIADPLIEFMDVVYIRDYKGRVFQSFISDVDFSYFGMTVIKCSADSPLRNNQSGGRNPVSQLKQLIENEKTEREKALERLNQMLKDSSGIYTTAEEQPDGSVIMYIHNKPTVEESKYVIKITGEAMGISNDGGETYIYGLTYDGEAILRKIYAEGIDADYITTGHLSADRILGGTLELGGWNNENGVLKIIDENGEVIGIWDKEGVTILKGKLSAALIVGGILTLGGLNNQHGILNILDEEGNLIGSWNKDGINALKGTFAGNITIGGETDGVCTILNAEGTEVARIDVNGVSTFGEDRYGENVARLYGGYLRFYRDSSVTGHVGTSYAALGENGELISGVALFTNGEGKWIGLGHESNVYFMYHSLSDEFKMFKDLNMNGHRIYNAVIEGASGGGSGVGEFINEEKNSEIFNSYKDITNDEGKITAKKNYINPKTNFAHVSGQGNSIDDGIEANYSNMAAVLGGNNNKILAAAFAAIVGGVSGTVSAQLAAIIGGSGNKAGGTMACIAGGNGNSCDGSMSFVGAGMNNAVSDISSAIIGGRFNKILLANGWDHFIGGGSSNKISGTAQNAICGGSSNEVEGAQSAILAGIGNQILNNSTTCAIIACMSNIIKKNAGGYSYYCAIVCGTNNAMFSGGNSVIIGGNSNKIGEEQESGGSGSCVILGGYHNTIKIASQYCAVLYGENNTIYKSYRSCVGGSDNNLKESMWCTVFGQGHNVTGRVGLFVCGKYSDITKAVQNDAMFVIGNGYNNAEKNIFYITSNGDVYARSFNIIGESTASEASAFSAAPTDQSSDLSALNEQIDQIKSEIQKLKEENSALRQEVESLKANF